MRGLFEIYKIAIYILFISLNIGWACAGTLRDVVGANEELRECSKKFEGVIEPGDLTNSIDRLIGSRVCLNSPGGSLSEVTKFIELLQEKNGFGAGGDDAMTFATRVQAGDKCESACAVLFMFGSNKYRTAYQDKILEPGAKLGFHSPFIDPRLGDKYSGDVAFAGGIQIANLLSAATYKTSTPAGVLPQELLSIIFGTPPDQMHYIDTCVEMHILGISTPDSEEFGRDYRDGFQDCVTNETVTVSNTLEAAVEAAHRVCTLSHVVRYRNWFVNRDYKYADILDFAEEMLAEKPKLIEHSVKPTANGGRITVALNSLVYWVPNWMTNAADQFCVVDLKGVFSGTQAQLTFNSPYVTFGSMADYNSLSEILDNSYRFSTDQAFGLSKLDSKFLPSTGLKNIDQRSDAIPSWARKQKTLPRCGIDASEARIGNVQNSTNLRQKAGLNGRVIARVGLGETVRIMDPGGYLRYDRCAAACDGVNQNAINTCIDNNDVWIEVEYNGQRGFLSRKFLQ